MSNDGNKMLFDATQGQEKITIEDQSHDQITLNAAERRIQIFAPVHNTRYEFGNVEGMPDHGVLLVSDAVYRLVVKEKVEEIKDGKKIMVLAGNYSTWVYSGDYSTIVVGNYLTNVDGNYHSKVKNGDYLAEVDGNYTSKVKGRKLDTTTGAKMVTVLGGKTDVCVGGKTDVCAGLKVVVEQGVKFKFGKMGEHLICKGLETVDILKTILKTRKYEVDVTETINMKATDIKFDSTTTTWNNGTLVVKK